MKYPHTLENKMAVTKYVELHTRGKTHWMAKYHSDLKKTLRGLDRKLPELKMFASGIFRSHIVALDVHQCFLLGTTGCTWLQHSLIKLICERIANRRRHRSPPHAEEENHQCCELSHPKTEQSDTKTKELDIDEACCTRVSQIAGPNATSSRRRGALAHMELKKTWEIDTSFIFMDSQLKSINFYCFPL